MKTTFSTTYYCRSSKQNKQGLSPLELCININGQRLFVNLPAKFSAKEFNKKRKPTHIENLINQYRIKVNEIMTSIMMDNQPITSALIKDYLQTGGVKAYSVQNLCDDFIKHISHRSITSTVLSKYKLVSVFLIDELGADKQLSCVNNADCVCLYETLKQRYLLSTSAGYMTRIKSMFQYAFDNGKIKINPTNQIKINKGSVKVEYLSDSDIFKIKSMDLTDYPKLDRVRDLLTFQCGTGVAYADLLLFDSNRIEEINGINVYTNNRQKTKVEYTCVVLNDAMNVLNKYNGSLPIISNQNYNKYLKELQKLAQVETNITTHLLRKTYAHHLLNNGVKIEVVSKCLGHTNTQITQKCYCKPNKELVIDEIGKLFK